MQYLMHITEVLGRDVIVEAENPVAAEELTEELCCAGVIDLGMRDWGSRTVECVSAATTEDRKYNLVYDGGEAKVAPGFKVNHGYFKALPRENKMTFGQLCAYTVWRDNHERPTLTPVVSSLPWGGSDLKQDTRDFLDTLRNGGIRRFIVTDQTVALLRSVAELIEQDCELVSTVLVDGKTPGLVFEF